MHRAPVPRLGLLISIAATLFAPPAIGNGTHTASPAQGAASTPVLLDLPGPNRSQAALAAGLAGVVRVVVEVDSTGLVTGVQLAEGGPTDPLTEGALEAARWAVFEPAIERGRPVSAQDTIRVTFPPLADVEPLAPQQDRAARAIEAEAARDTLEALSWWVGALGMVGREPTLPNPWPLRERIILLHRGRSLAVQSGINRTVTTARNEIERTANRQGHERWAPSLDQALAEVPWYPPLLRWRSVVAAATDRRADALRWTRLYAMAATDSADVTRARAALPLIGANDLVRATIALKR